MKNTLKTQKAKIITAIITLSICIFIAVVCITTINNKRQNEKAQAESTTYSQTTDETTNNNTDKYSELGNILYLDLSKSFDPDNVQKVYIESDRADVIFSDQSVFYGYAKSSENYTPDTFKDYLERCNLSEVNPIDLSQFSNITVTYNREENDDFGKNKFAVIQLDSIPSLLGYVYQDENENDLIWCLRNINNDTEYPSKISRDEAINIALKKQNELYPNMNISLKDVKLYKSGEQFFAFNTIYNINTSGHRFYGITYFDDDTLCDNYYYCVDEITGEILFYSLMGD